jgi:hypothetical protein
MAEMESEPKFNKQLLGALNSTSVTNRLTDIMKNVIVANEKLITDDVNKKFAELMASISLLRDELKQRDSLIASLKDANIKLSAENTQLKNRINEMDSAARRDNLTFTGLTLSFADVASDNASTSSSSQRIVDQVVELCNTTRNVSVSSNDISAAFPIHKGTSTTPSVVLVKFVRRCQRDSVYLARKKLQSLSTGRKIFINENLPQDTRKLLGTLRSSVKSHTLLGAWTNFGKVYVKKLDSSIMQVKSLSDLV